LVLNRRQVTTIRQVVAMFGKVDVVRR